MRADESQAAVVRRGFSLIELLVVVAIVAILAVIAIPNMLEAQTRAKVSRTRADFRAIASALEAYYTDGNHFPPNDGVFYVVPAQLTTPVAFLTNAQLVDPFMDKARLQTSAMDPQLVRFYTYTKVLPAEEFDKLMQQGAPAQPSEGIDAQEYNLGALKLEGEWRLASNGPDLRYTNFMAPAGPFNAHPSAQAGCDIPFDSTNGTNSLGNILRYQSHPDGIAPAY